MALKRMDVTDDDEKKLIDEVRPEKGRGQLDKNEAPTNHDVKNSPLIGRKNTYARSLFL